VRYVKEFDLIKKEFMEKEYSKDERRERFPLNITQHIRDIKRYEIELVINKFDNDIEKRKRLTIKLLKRELQLSDVYFKYVGVTIERKRVEDMLLNYDESEYKPFLNEQLKFLRSWYNYFVYLENRINKIIENSKKPLFIIGLGYEKRTLESRIEDNDDQHINILGFQVKVFFKIEFENFEERFHEVLFLYDKKSTETLVLKNQDTINKKIFSVWILNKDLFSEQFEIAEYFDRYKTQYLEIDYKKPHIEMDTVTLKYYQKKIRDTLKKLLLKNIKNEETFY